VTDSYDYKAYGSTYASTGSTVNPFCWVGMLGYYLDIDRLAYYLRARAYSPQLARFLSQDPLYYVDGANTYAYVRLLPVQLVDPTGLTCKVCRWRRHYQGETISTPDPPAG
jgi:RHS repeat-associated protein